MSCRLRDYTWRTIVGGRFKGACIGSVVCRACDQWLVVSWLYCWVSGKDMTKRGTFFFWCEKQTGKRQSACSAQYHKVIAASCQTTTPSLSHEGLHDEHSRTSDAVPPSQNSGIHARIAQGLPFTCRALDDTIITPFPEKGGTLLWCWAHTVPAPSSCLDNSFSVARAVLAASHLPTARISMLCYELWLAWHHRAFLQPLIQISKYSIGGEVIANGLVHIRHMAAKLVSHRC